MKKIIFLSLMILISFKVFSQSHYKYNGGDTIVGKNVKYVCKAEGRIPNLVEVYNITNKDTTFNIYTTDGELIYDPSIAAKKNYSDVDIHNIAKQVFSQTELLILKGNNVVLSIRFTTDNKGIADEITFFFMKNDPILSTLNPDKFYELEKRLKVVFCVSISEYYNYIRNPKWNDGISFGNIE